MKSVQTPNTIAIPILSDNYVWLYPHPAKKQVIVIDPGDAGAVIQYCLQYNLTPAAIWITHTHYDHIGGVARLMQQFNIPVYGPEPSIRQVFPHAHILADGDTLTVGHDIFTVLSVPGHTLDHIAYYCAASYTLFCGDTLFSSGCGYLFEGTPTQMHQSLSRLMSLPNETRCYCTHEYTLSNLAFAQEVEPDNMNIHKKISNCKALRQNHQATLPTTIGIEKLTNPFLRCHESSVKMAAEHHACKNLTTTDEVFAALRSWKNTFQEHARL